jgi:hypothetical protein
MFAYVYIHSSTNGVLGISGSSDVGDSTGETSSIVALTFADTVPATLVAAGLENTCALFENGKIRCWGANNNLIGTAQVGVWFLCFWLNEVFLRCCANCSQKKKKKKKKK